MSGLHQDVVLAAEALGVAPAVVRPDVENAGYGGAVGLAADGVVRFRVARVTPRKPGLFVAVWRRAADGSTEPFGVADQERLVVVVREGARFGAFVLPSPVLAARGVVAIGGRGGKRGFRLYPPWSDDLNAQATTTRAWQHPYYADLA